MRLDKVWLVISSELFVNLAAAWFGAAIIVPNFVGFRTTFNILILIGDLSIGIISLIIAFKLRKLSRKRKL